ncbi:MAG TPA: efflux RND transporter periplasmic adaptor subunit [Kofleriaceae bacterium]|jgi:RND family efflux transporter MFP subunit
MPTEPAQPRQQVVPHHGFDGLDEATEIGMMLPPEAAAINAHDERRRAGLAALSLNKGPGPQPQMHTPLPQMQQMAPNATYAPAYIQHRPSKLPWVLLAMVLIGGGVYIAKFKSTDAPPAPAAGSPIAMPTTTAPVHSGGFVASGYIAAKAPIVLAASTTGRLAALKVDNGDRVTKGQVVAILEDTSLRADLNLANAKLRDAQRQAKSLREAQKLGAATMSQVDTAQGAVEVAQAETYRIGQQIEAMKIHSPVDGTVLEILARPGETVAAAGTGIGVMRLADLTQLVAEADVSETDLKGLALNQYAEVTTDAARDKPFIARVKEISTQADRSRGTVLVRSYLDASAGAVLKPGNSVQVRFLGDQLPTPPTTDGATAPAAGSGSAAGSAAATRPPTGSDTAAKTDTPAAGSDAGSAAPATATTDDKTPADTKKTTATKAKAKVRYVPKKTPKKKGGGLDI